VRQNLKLAQKAHDEDNLENLILEAIEEVYREVRDGPEDSENFTEIAFSTTEDKKSTSRKSHLSRNSQRASQTSSKRSRPQSSRPSLCSSRSFHQTQIFDAKSRVSKQSSAGQSKDRSLFKRVMKAVDTRQILPKDAKGCQELVDPTLGKSEREKQRETLG
jgi:DNA mismatch repair ATPase MutL